VWKKTRPITYSSIKRQESMRSIVVVTEYQVTIATNYTDLKLCSRSRTSEQCFVSVYRVYSESTDILIWICEV
jgi:hypothetical protein